MPRAPWRTSDALAADHLAARPRRHGPGLEPPQARAPAAAGRAVRLPGRARVPRYVQWRLRYDFVDGPRDDPDRQRASRRRQGPRGLDADHPRPHRRRGCQGHRVRGHRARRLLAGRRNGAARGLLVRQAAGRCRVPVGLAVPTRALLAWTACEATLLTVWRCQQACSWRSAWAAAPTLARRSSSATARRRVVLPEGGEV